jgi:beta-N-acetylhexosaminidase
MATELESLSTEEKIGQLFFIGISGTSLDERTKALLDEVRPGGVCLFSRNIKEAEQTRNLLNAINERLNISPLLSLDQEGGLVDRLRRVVTPMPAASDFRAAENVRRFARIIAETARLLGFNMNFAPVVDVVDERRSAFNNGLRSRAFGTSTEQAAEFAGAFLREMQANGILGCIKHFPGLGAAEVDSHEELPLVNITDEEFSATDLLPYRHLTDRRAVHAIMVAHAAYPSVGLQETAQDGRLLPASLSRSIITDLLREQLGFDGVVITDDLEMGAIVRNYGIGDACKMAINAGVDLLAICADEDKIREGFLAITDAVHNGEITENRLNESVQRIFELKAKMQPPLPFDANRIGQLSDEIADLKDSLE